MRDDFYTLPPGLPVPVDDGAADHLVGMRVPAVRLESSSGRWVDLAEQCRGLTSLFFFPRTGRPDEAKPERWDEIPGARGCTPQCCAYRDQHAAFASLGSAVFGVSVQDAAFHRELVERVRLPYEVLSDERFELVEAMGLPTFRWENLRLNARLAMVCDRGVVERVFYPVFPPDRNAADVLAHLQGRARGG